MADIRVAFPDPCLEKWEDMSSRGCNRHCASCDKIVHDMDFLTVDQVETLLESGDEICVRAKIRPDGSVKTSNAFSRSSKRIVTAIGATVTLATAACQTSGTTGQTSGTAGVSPRFEIKGSVGDGWASSATLTSSDGKSRTKTLRGDLNFRFSNLRPGNYTLTFMGTCYERHRVENIVVRNDMDLGSVQFDDEIEDCIIVGRIEKEKEIRLG
jgi:hypothetical protein